MLRGCSPRSKRIRDSVRRESAFALTLGAALAGAAAGSLVFGPGRAPFAMLLAFGLTGYFVSDPVWSPRRLGGWSLAGTLVALVAARAIHPDDVIAALPFVIPGALAFGLLVLSLTSTLRTLSAAASHEDGALARVSSARWLLVVSLGAGLVSALRFDLPLLVSAILIALFGGVRWALGRDALTTRRRWLAHVRDEDAIGWRIVAATKVDELETLSLRPLVRARPVDGVLVRTGPGGPYRGLGGTPVALVPRSSFRIESPGRTVPWSEAGTVLAFFGAISVPWFAFDAGAWIGRAMIGSTAGGSWSPLAGGLAFAVAAPIVLALSHLAGEKRRLVWLAALVAFSASLLVRSRLGW